MRFALCGMLLSGALLAQDTPPPSGDQAAPKAAKPEPEALKRAKERLREELMKRFREQPQLPAPAESEGPATLAPGQPCAIPLKNVLPQNPGNEPNRIRIFPPAGRFASRDVILPAPSCDDVKR